MKKLLLITLVTAFVSGNSFGDSDRKPSNVLEYNCSETGTGNAELLIRVPDPLPQDKKMDGIFLQVTSGTKTLFSTKNARVYAEDVVVSFNGRQSRVRMSGTLFLDELDQTSITLKFGKKKRKTYNFDCNTEE